MAIDLVGATLGWLVQELGGRNSRKGFRRFFGTPEERAFRIVVHEAVREAVAEVGGHLEPDAQEHVASVLLGNGVEAPDLFARGNREMGQIIAEWLDALGEPQTGSVGYFDAIGVDRRSLARSINHRIVGGVAAEGRRGGSLSPFAELLWRDDTTESLKALDRRTERLLASSRRDPVGGGKDQPRGRAATIVILATSEDLYLTACRALFARPGRATIRSGAAYGRYETANITWQVWIACTQPGGVRPLGVAHALHAIDPDLVLSLGNANAGGSGAARSGITVARHLFLRQPGSQEYYDVMAFSANVMTLPPLLAVAGSIHGTSIGTVIGIADSDFERTAARAQGEGGLFTSAASLTALSAALAEVERPVLPVFSVAKRRSWPPSAPWRVGLPPTDSVASWLASFLASVTPADLPAGRRRFSGRARNLAPAVYLVDTDEGNDWSDHQQRTDEHFVGRTIGRRYELTREIGGGALNDVWEASERAFGGSVGSVAVKLQAPTSRRRRSYFAREATFLANCDNVNVIPYRAAGVEEDGELKGWGYIVTGLASKSLHAVAASGPPTGYVMKAMAAGIARGLSYLHDHDLVHCDVKPANILCYNDRWVLGDLGLAQRAGTARPEGTIGYMAPERFDGFVTPKSDVYALGVTLHVAMSSERLHEESTLELPTIEHIWRAIESAPPPPAIDDYVAAHALRDLLRAMLITDPRKRISIGEVIDRVSSIDPEEFSYCT